TLETTFVVLPARIVQIGIGDTDSTAQNPAAVNSVVGQKLKVWVFFNAPPAPTDWQSQNAWLDIQCGGNVSVQCPHNLAIHEQDCNPQFCRWNSDLNWTTHLSP